MNITHLCKILLVAILFTGNATFAQGNNTVWKKKVARMIEMGQKDDVDHHLTAKDDTSLSEMILMAVKTGKLTAYSNFDNSFTTKLKGEYINELIGGQTDTVSLTDPVTGKEEIKIVHRDFDYSQLHKYRILEEWGFDPHTGKTEIQITGIAPIRDIYGDDGTFRGVQAIFWVRYNEVRSIITRYEQYHPDNTLAGHIWADYFLSDVKPEVQK